MLGMYPGDAGQPGGDVAGRVTAVGAGVDSALLGQLVFGQAAGCLGNAVVTNAQTVVPVPPGLTPDAAATVPTVFLTADACLGAAANLRPGQRVLIHAATGGLGLAAVQVARAMGAVPLGSAGSPGKRSFLRSYASGVHCALDSRSTAFADEALLTAGGPVDAVLNSLTSTGMVAASLAGLAQGGSFVEVGKNGIWSAGRVAQERSDVTFHTGAAKRVAANVPLRTHALHHTAPLKFGDFPLSSPYAVAVDFMPPQTINAGLRRIAMLLASGTIAALPPVAYSLGATAAALRQLSAARHVGKIVVADASASPLCSSAADGLWVISGGMGALGMLSARWLSSVGLRRLVLLGRSGLAEGAGSSASAVYAASLPAPSPTTDTAGMMAEATVHGRWAAAVTMAKCDAAALADVGGIALGSQASALGMPVVGVLHAGGLLRDATLPNQGLPGLRAVFAPKAAGSRSLASSAPLLPLAALNFFSSVAAALGSGGQANYAAANATLDAAAVGLQATGVPGLSVGWGAWAGAGMAAHAGLERMERLGFGAIAPGAGMAALAALLGGLSSAGSCGMVGIQPPTLVASVFFWDHIKAASPLFTEVKAVWESLSVVGGADVQPSTVDCHTVAAPAASPASALLSTEAIAAAVAAAVIAVLGFDPGPNAPLVGAGIDSLGAVELRNEIGRRAGCELPGTLVYDYPTSTAIAAYLADRLAPALVAEEDTVCIGEIAGLATSRVTDLGASQHQLVLVTDVRCRVAEARGLDGIAAIDPIGPIPADRWDPDFGAAVTAFGSAAARSRSAVASARFGG